MLALRDLAHGQGPQGPPGTPPLTPFKDPLPIPPVHRPVSIERIQPKGFDGPAVDAVNFDVSMTEATHQFHADLPPTRLYGYSGMYPGPTFEVRSGQPVQVRFRNNLPGDRHLLSHAIDPTLYGSQPGIPEVRSIVHLHGAKVLPDSDGNPEAWYTRDNRQTGPAFAGDVYYYPNDQAASTLWYHDHTIGITRLNVAAGLAGFYLIRDEAEDALNIPKGAFEIPVVLQDRVVNANGSINYPGYGLTNIHPVWQPDYFTDVPVINGKIRPFLEVEPRKYRLRLLNGSNSRYFNMRIEEQGSTSRANPFIQIGADQGFLPAPVSVETLLLSPGERADVIVDFSAFAGKNLVITNDAKTPFGLPFDLPIPIPPPPSPLMQFRVRTSTSSPDTTAIPTRLPQPETLVEDSATITRDISMVERTVGAPFDPRVRFPTLLLLENKMFEEPVGVMPAAGSTEVWRFINAVIGGHPMHIHLGHFNVLDRQFFDPDAYEATGNINFRGPRVPAQPNELNAPKDTVHVGFAEVVRVLVKFDLPKGTSVKPDQRFRYMHHCHILEHEDNEMMRPFDVIGR